MGKIKNELLLTIAVMVVLTLICVVTVWENSQKEYVEVYEQTDVYGNTIEELENAKFYKENSRGKILTFITMREPTDEEFNLKYETLYNKDVEKLDKYRYSDIWLEVKKMVYEEQISSFIEDCGCYSGDIIFSDGRVREAVILYATREEMELYRTHPYVTDVNDWEEMYESWELKNQ